MSVYCCLQTCNYVVNVLVMGLILGQSLIVISTTGILLYAKVSPLYNVLWEWLCCLHINYIVYKHFNTWVHVGPQSLGVCEVSYTYLLGCWRYYVKDILTSK